MGIIEMGPPKKLVLQIKNLLDATDFIETGTFKGETAKWASEYFDQVDTIEFSKSFFDELVDKYGKSSNLNLHFGDSREVLKKISPKIKKPSIFWLDGHWCGDADSYGGSDQCPLLKEIDVITNLTMPSYAILIDDARLFLSPPSKPNKIEQWPSIDIIIEHLKKGMINPYIVVYHDVIVAVPESIKSDVAGFVQSENTKEWRNQGIKNKISLYFILMTIYGHFVGPFMKWYKQLIDRIENKK